MWTHTPPGTDYYGFILERVPSASESLLAQTAMAYVAEHPNVVPSAHDFGDRNRPGTGKSFGHSSECRCSPGRLAAPGSRTKLTRLGSCCSSKTDRNNGLSINRRLAAKARRRAKESNSPTLGEWVESQPAQWCSAALVFALNANTPGGVVGVSVDEMISVANSRGVKISRRTFMQRVKLMQGAGIVWQDRKRPEAYDGGFRQEPSTWFIRTRQSMPGTLEAPPADDLGSEDDRTEAWLRLSGVDQIIKEMNYRVARQPTAPPF